MLHFHMSKIILTTLNSRFTHTSIALRYLYANLKELQTDAKILEFSIKCPNAFLIFITFDARFDFSH